MAQIMINVNSREAEDLLFALKLRACQTRVPEDSKRLMERLRQQINAQCEFIFQWQHLPNRLSADANDIRVSVQTRNRW